ncbi:MAG: tetratricopeptide repeat protein [Muribaculaceae bacterium]|nr:tetratricopeptide repeat protein [Muribaculaceae bacterium]
MKKIYILLTIFVASNCFYLISNAQSLSSKAEAAYTADNYIEAQRLYLEAEKKEGISSELFFNIGNTYYRLGNKGKAILYYERALNIDPSNEEARTNLEFVNSKIVDKTDVDEANIIIKSFQDIRNIMTSNNWAIIAIILFILLLSAIALYVFATSVLARKVGFFGGFALAILVIITNYYAFSSRNKVENRHYAIITTQSVTLSTSPRIPKDKSEEAFILNEGTKIYILDSVDNKTNGKIERWYDIKADDTHRAWIKKDNIDII